MRREYIVVTGQYRLAVDFYDKNIPIDKAYP